MEHLQVLLSGPELSENQFLINGLRKSVDVFVNPQNLDYNNITQKKYDLIIVEMNDESEELKMVEKIKNENPLIKIILINGEGNQKLTARVFAAGVDDVFHKPYKIPFLIERVNALLHINYST